MTNNVFKKSHHRQDVLRRLVYINFRLQICHEIIPNEQNATKYLYILYHKRVNVTPKQYFYDESKDKHAILCETNPLHFCLELQRFHLIISHQGAVESKYLTP